jgi:hypothetical protein
MRTSGEAFSRNQRFPSALTAADDWVLRRAWTLRERTPAQFLQAQFHWGNPPPAAVPSKRTFIESSDP